MLDTLSGSDTIWHTGACSPMLQCLPNAMTTYCQSNSREHIPLNLIENSNIFTCEYAFEKIVCKMAVTVFIPQCVDTDCIDW